MKEPWFGTECKNEKENFSKDLAKKHSDDIRNEISVAKKKFRKDGSKRC